MKEIKLFLLFILFLLKGFSQEEFSEEAYLSCNSYDVLYGTNVYTSNFYNQLNTVQKSTIFRPLQIVGIGCSFTNVYVNDYNYSGHIFFSQILPARIKIQDTLDCGITGNLFSMSAKGIDIFKNNENFDLVLSVGANVGRIRLFQNNFVRMKNPFFSPMVSIQPKLGLGPITLSFLCTFAYDISNPNWKKTIVNGRDLAKPYKFRQTCFTLLFSIGWTMEWY
ncbi:MAG: hypothetical protein IAF38_21005 [Bacteroidia bacterium]|nr:hypothetical protein [Bacteroidia bacterium]